MYKNGERVVALEDDTLLGLYRKKLHALPLALFSVDDRQMAFDMFPEAWNG